LQRHLLLVAKSTRGHGAERKLLKRPDFNERFHRRLEGAGSRLGRFSFRAVLV
jgi:hypothetical protein